MLIFSAGLCPLPTNEIIIGNGNLLITKLPAAISLAVFVSLLILHPAASGWVYAAYGGVYVATALHWLRVVDGVKLSVFG